MLLHAGPSGILEYDTREWLKAAENHAPSLTPQRFSSGRERSPRKAARQERGTTAREAAAPETRRNSTGERLASAVPHCKEPCLAPQEGFTLSFGRRTNTYGSRQQSERICPHEHTSPLAWPSHPSGPSAVKGALATRNLTRAWALRHSKNHGWEKKPISKITLYFFVVEFTLMYCNLKRSGKTTCKRVSK